MSANVLFSEHHNGVSISFVADSDSIERLQDMEDTLPEGVTFKTDGTKVTLEIEQKKQEKKLGVQTMLRSAVISFLKEKELRLSDCQIISAGTTLVDVYYEE